MWADTGLAAPSLMQEVSLQQVLQAVQQVITQQKTEVLVTPTPVRPLLAIYAIFPSLGAWLLRRMGIWSTLQKRADFARQKHKN